MWFFGAFLLYWIYQNTLIHKYKTFPKANKHENMLISKPFAFYWPWSFGTSHHNWNYFEDFGSQMNFCHSAMPVHVGNNCTKQGKTNQCCTHVKWGHLRIYMKGMAILSTKSLIKKVSAGGMIAPYQAGNKRNLLRDTQSLYFFFP